MIDDILAEIAINPEPTLNHYEWCLVADILNEAKESIRN